MVRHALLVTCALAFIGGCAQPQMQTGPPQKPTPAPELAKLARLIGTWGGTAEMVSPSPEEMKSEMPEGAEEMPSTFAGSGKFEWTLGGMCLRGEGWYEMGPDQRANYVEFWTWDAKVKMYRILYLNDWGEIGQGWAWFDDDGNTIRMKSSGQDAEGTSKRGQGTMTFLGNDAYEWTWSEKGPMGKMEMKGTSRRER